MFATLLGPYPAMSPASTEPAVDGRPIEDEFVRELIAEQEAAGLEPLTDGHARSVDPVLTITGGLDGFDLASGQSRAIAEPRWRGPITVDAWRFAAGCTTRAVKQALVGPYTLGCLVDPGVVGRERLTLALAEALREELLALCTAGCPLVQVDEDAATRIGDDPTERRLFREAQRRLTAGVEGAHLSLSVASGSADVAGAETIFDAPYQSYLFDLIAGPDNWRLIAEAPGDRGIVCGALDPFGPETGQLEVLVWAARYAASTGGRGMDRVGLAPAAGLERLARERAREKIRVLGEAARLATASRDELARVLDWRALDAPWRRRPE